MRLTDKNLPGLGVAVPARNHCDTDPDRRAMAGIGVTLKVKGLQANESYVFAIAAYSQRGELVGGSIGATGRPIVACYALSMLMLWGYCCQVGLVKWGCPCNYHELLPILSTYTSCTRVIRGPL